MKRLILAWLVVEVMALQAWICPAMAVEVYQATVSEQALYGASHIVEFEYSDFTESTTNTAEAFTNVFAVPAKFSVECVGMVLEKAFDTGNTNYTGSCALKVGDGSDDDLFLTSTELASDGTEVWVSFGRPLGATIASTLSRQTGTFLTAATAQSKTDLVYSATPQTTSITYLDATTSAVSVVVCTNVVVTTGTGVTNIVPTTASAMTNGTIASTATVAELGRKLYTSAGNVVFTFTPNSEEALDDNTAGKVTIYLRLVDAR